MTRRRNDKTGAEGTPQHDISSKYMPSCASRQTRAEDSVAKTGRSSSHVSRRVWSLDCTNNVAARTMLELGFGCVPVKIYRLYLTPRNFESRANKLTTRIIRSSQQRISMSNTKYDQRKQMRMIPCKQRTVKQKKAICSKVCKCW